MTDAPEAPRNVMANAPRDRQASPRAVRNKNPGNIERGIKWIGLEDPAKMSAEQKSENRFAVFSHPKYGFRAMATVILTYARKRHASDGSAIDTIGDVIARWAPPVENNTAGYARRVAEAVGVSVTTRVDLESYAVLAPMIKAMATVEAGGWYWSESDRDEGLRLCGVARPNASPASQREAAAIGVGAAAASAGSVIEVIKGTSDVVTAARPALDTWQGLYAALPTVALVIAGAVLVYVAYRWVRRNRRVTA